MSVTVALQTYYGIETKRETFWTTTGEAFVCGQDLSHQIVEGAKFCPVCGIETRRISIEAPAPRFAAICKKSGIEPAKFFDLLNGYSDHGWEWEDDGKDGSGQSFRIFWFNVAGFVEGYAPGDVGCISALGIKLDDLAHSKWDREDPRVSAVTWNEMGIYDRAMREVAKIFGVEGEPKLFSQVYYG